MTTQGITPYSFAPLKVTTGGRTYVAIDAESDKVSSLGSSTTFTSTSINHGFDHGESYCDLYFEQKAFLRGLFCHLRLP